MKREAIRMYEDANDHKPFKFEHCWEIIIKNPKWCSKELTKTCEKEKQKNRNRDKVHGQPPSNATNESNSSEGEDHSVTDTVAANCENFDGIERPQRRKGCKEKKRRLNDDKLWLMLSTIYKIHWQNKLQFRERS